MIRSCSSTEIAFRKPDCSLMVSKRWMSIERMRGGGSVIPLYAELAKLLGDAGFTDVGATPSYGYYSVVRATRR